MTHLNRKTQVPTAQESRVLTPRASIDDKEKRRNPTTVDSMYPPNSPGNTFLSRKDTFTDRWHQEPADVDDIDEADEEIPQRDNGPSSAVPPMASPPPTDDELGRLERLVALQERAARIVPAPGHHYGDLTVTGDARAVRGNSFDRNDIQAQVLARRHRYGSAKAEKKGSLYDGDLNNDNMNAFFNRTNNSAHHGDRAKR